MKTAKNQPLVGSLSWGECCCPQCQAVLKADQDAVRFFARYKRDAMLFMLCPACAAIYDRSKPDERSRFRDQCLHNIENCSGSRSHFACTTLMAIRINHGDFCAAVENGICGLDQMTYELIASSDEAVIFVNGLPVHWQGLPEIAPTTNWGTSGLNQYQH
jgi:hypothetical protein